VSHPFHALCGREFELVTQKLAWGEDRVYFRDKAKRLRHVPLGWTSLAPHDLFRSTAKGACRFRTEDLLRLADLLHASTIATPTSRKDNNAVHVKEMTPTTKPDNRRRDPLRQKVRARKA